MDAYQYYRMLGANIERPRPYHLCNNNLSGLGAVDDNTVPNLINLINKVKASLMAAVEKMPGYINQYHRVFALLQEVSQRGERDEAYRAIAIKWLSGKGKTLALMDMLWPLKYDHNNLVDFNAFSFMDTYSKFKADKK